MGDKPPGTIKDLLKYVNDQNAVLRKEVEELKQSMTFMNDSFEAFRMTGEELEALKKEHAALKLEKDELAQTLAKTQKELIELKQYSRLSNVEIKGIPETEDESLVEVVQKIGEKIGMDVETTDIDVVHRVPTKEKTKKNVIVKFASRAARDKFLQSARKKRLSANDIGFSETTPVYLNEHLCPEYKALLGMAIARKKANNWKFVWVSNSKILARKAENSTVIHIATRDDLSKIV
ncbi:uncharacterized protein LOC144102789 [Amblyomma americanum]